MRYRRIEWAVALSCLVDIYQYRKKKRLESECTFQVSCSLADERRGVVERVKGFKGRKRWIGRKC